MARKTVHHFMMWCLATVSCATACQQITLEYCQSVLPYNRTTFPNYLGHETQSEAALSLVNTVGLLESLGCSDLTTAFLCTLMTPKCHVYSGVKLPPCREFCQKAIQPCFASLVFSSLEMDCNLFPSELDYPYCISESMLVRSTPSPAPTRPATNKPAPATQSSKVHVRMTTLQYVTAHQPLTQVQEKPIPSGPTFRNIAGTTQPAVYGKVTGSDVRPMLPWYPASRTKIPTMRLPRMTPPTFNSDSASSSASDESVLFVDGLDKKGKWNQFNNVNSAADGGDQSPVGFFSSTTRIVLGVSVGALVTMVTMLSMCICFRFYSKSKSTGNQNIQHNTDIYSGFYANPAFDNVQLSHGMTHSAKNGLPQMAPVVSSSQTNSQNVPELATLSQLPPHPASEPLRSTQRPSQPASAPPYNSTTPRPKEKYQAQKQNSDTTTKSAVGRASALSQTWSSSMTFERRSAYHSYMIENSLPDLEEMGVGLPPGVSDTPGPLPLPPHKVLETTGSLPYQADLFRHPTYNQNSVGKKKQSTRFSNFSWTRKSGYSYSGDDTYASSAWSERSSRADIPAQDLIYANPSVKESDMNGNGIMTEIDLTEGGGTRNDHGRVKEGTSGRIAEGKDRGTRREVNSNFITGTT